jgi:hypothetical protein
LSWAELDQSNEVYRDPQVAYPQALSIVAFLIDRYGLESFLEFLAVSAQKPGYRSALNTAYGKSADQLEQEWLLYLPEYFAGRWKINAIYAYDLSQELELVNKAAYTAAESRLSEIVSLLEATDQVETLAQAEALLAQSRQGQAAGVLAGEARAALQAGDYPRAMEKGNAAMVAYESLGFQERIPEIQNYIYRAELGQAALAQLAVGQQQLEAFNFSEAERQLQQATALLQALGNDPAAQQGQALLTEVSWRQRLIMYVLLGVALLLIFFTSLRRIVNRFLAGPLEMEFTT